MESFDLFSRHGTKNAHPILHDLIPSSLSPPVLTPLSSLLLDDAGDSPDEVKARLKYWAQAVACTVRLCS